MKIDLTTHKSLSLPLDREAVKKTLITFIANVALASFVIGGYLLAGKQFAVLSYQTNLSLMAVSGLVLFALASILLCKRVNRKESVVEAASSAPKPVISLPKVRPIANIPSLIEHLRENEYLEGTDREGRHVVLTKQWQVFIKTDGTLEFGGACPRTFRNYQDVKQEIDRLQLHLVRQTIVRTRWETMRTMIRNKETFPTQELSDTETPHFTQQLTPKQFFTYTQQGEMRIAELRENGELTTSLFDPEGNKYHFDDGQKVLENDFSFDAYLKYLEQGRQFKQVKLQKSQLTS